jgi:hypothetical protein
MGGETIATVAAGATGGIDFADNPFPLNCGGSLLYNSNEFVTQDPTVRVVAPQEF